VNSQEKEKEWILDARGGSLCLKLIFRDTGWIRCTLQQKVSCFIGAERLGYLVPRLSNWLISPKCSKPLRVVSFAETHYALYGLVDSTSRYLLFQDKFNTFVACLTLTSEECRDWRKHLQELCKELGLQDY
jgi:hypothetical protein